MPIWTLPAPTVALTRMRQARSPAREWHAGSWPGLRGLLGERIGDDRALLGVRCKLAFAERHVAQHDARIAQVFVGDALHVGDRDGLRLGIADAEGEARIVEENLILGQLKRLAEIRLHDVEEGKLLSGFHSVLILGGRS